VPAALNARQFFAPLDLVIEVTDPQGHAAGRYHLGATVTTTEKDPALTLSVNELSAIYLGGVSATTLHAAGRITEHEAGAVSQLDSAFRSPVTPWLSVWF
jgi:predicted acetyltransferase